MEAKKDIVIEYEQQMVRKTIYLDYLNELTSEKRDIEEIEKTIKIYYEEFIK